MPRDACASWGIVVTEMFMSESKYKAVLFDMDGTLIDDEPFFLCQTRDYLAGLGVKISMREMTKIIGSNNAEAKRIRAAWVGQNVDPDELAKEISTDIIIERIDYE